MRRRTLHRGFAIASLVVSLVIAAKWLSVSEADAITDALSRIPISAVTMPSDDILDSTEIALAWANSLSAGGNFEGAEAMFNNLVQQPENVAIVQVAQFNLANMYLRQALQPDIAATRAGPLLELAKQRYRDLLALNPNHWDARYNLERALRLAPENAKKAGYDKGDPIKRVRVIVPDFKAKDLP